MKKYIYILAALSMVPAMSLAQTLESDVDAELDQMYSGAEAAPAAAQPVQAGISATAPVSGGSQPIYILNQATPTASSNAQVQQTQVQKQPTTVIEASPLTESRAEQIRRSRQDAELQTEQRIVEKLEVSRMEDEKKRANVLFGDKLNNMNNQENTQVQIQQPVQPIVIQQVPVQKVEEPKENTRDIVREEIAAAMKIEEEVVETPAESKYVAGTLGFADYPDTNNVRGNYSLGVSFGSKYDNIIVEGSFVYSNYTLSSNMYTTSPYGGYGYNGYNGYNNGYNMPREVDINQYSGILATKVQLFDGIVKPVFGALVSYSYRDYKWSNNNYSHMPSNSASSHAIDVGTVVGADLEFSPKYSLGVDFRYMWNLSSRIDKPSNSWMASPYYGTEIEKLQYYVMSLIGRVNF